MLPNVGNKYKRIGISCGLVTQTGLAPGVDQGATSLIVLPLHAVYIVPQSSMAGRVKAYVYPGNPNSIGRLEVYRENWDLL